MRNKLIAALRGLSAVVLMLFATNFLPVAAAFADQPDNVGNPNSMAADTTSTNTLVWTGNGSTNATPICEPGQTAQFHWILTPGGNVDITSGTLTVNYTTGSPDIVTGEFQGGSNGAMHFYTQQAVPTTVSSASVTYTYTGEQHNPVLTISDYTCIGTPTPTPAHPTATAESLACVEEGDSDGQVTVTVTNTADQTGAAASYAVTLNSVTKNTGSIADGDSASVTFTGLAPGDYTATITGSDQTSTRTNVTVDTCSVLPGKPAKPTVRAEATACVEGESDNGSVTVTVTNTADDTHAAVTYAVTLAGVTKHTASVPDGSTGSVTFTGLTSGNYKIDVAGSDDTTAKTTVRVKECKKVFVCKYVGKPGVNERLKKGNNGLVLVSTNAIAHNGWDGTVGSETSWFSDAQGRSYVLGYENDFEVPPTAADCPAPEGPTEVTPAVQFLNPTCENTSGRVVVTAMTGVTYKVNGHVITGTTSYPAGSSVTVKAVLATGFVLADAAHKSFPNTFAAAPTDCIHGATDVCPNITGDQVTVPAGMTKDKTTGNCITTVVTGGQGGDVLGASTTAPLLANTGQSPWAAIIVGVTVISLTLTSAFASRRIRLDA